jgi:hypothetical protein
MDVEIENITPEDQRVSAVVGCEEGENDDDVVTDPLKSRY